MSRSPRARTRRRRALTSTAVGIVVAAIIVTLACRSVSSSTVTEDDGVLPDGTTVFDDHFPGVANLDPGLLRALLDAARDAADDGIALYVNSGWRSPVYQNQLLDEAVAAYGSEAEADRWVAAADTSAHVSGAAVDIGYVDATVWLSEHGASHGLCQIYGNEPWHYELRPEAVSSGCPPPATVGAVLDHR